MNFQISDIGLMFDIAGATILAFGFIGIIFQFCQQTAKELCTTSSPSPELRLKIMPDLIRVKRELFGRVADIEAIVRAALQPPVAGKDKKPSKEVPGPAFKPEISL